jgi:hypothetical protein
MLRLWPDFPGSTPEAWRRIGGAGRGKRENFGVKSLNRQFGQSNPHGRCRAPGPRSTGSDQFNNLPV